MDSSSMSSIVMLVLLFGLMYFMLIRPQRKKEKQVQSMRDSLKSGDEIVTIGGIIGKIVTVKDEEVVIAVGADKTKLTIAKWGISGLVEERSTGSSSSSKKSEEDEKVTPKRLKRLGKSETPSEETAADAETPADAE